MRTVVLDACALIAYLRNEAGAQIVADTLADQETCCLAHKINLLEVYYDVVRQKGKSSAREALTMLRLDGVETRADFQWSFLHNVGDLKATEKLSLADCFGFALASQENAVLMTSDHHEFDRLLERYPKSIQFIR